MPPTAIHLAVLLTDMKPRGNVTEPGTQVVQGRGDGREGCDLIEPR